MRLSSSRRRPRVAVLLTLLAGLGLLVIAVLLPGHPARALPPVIDLDSTPADLTVYGDDPSSFSGQAVGVGDINGDTTDDLIIGAYQANAPGGMDAGATYVIYGGSSLPATIDLNSESAGLTVHGDDAYDWSGWSVGAGDINGDTTDDLIIGAPWADPVWGSDAGETYVIYGGTPGVDLPPVGGTFDLNSESADLTVYGADNEGFSGHSVGAGDIDGDTTDDLIIGAVRAYPAGGFQAGETYVIYGSGSLPATIDLTITSAGLTVYGDDREDYSGMSVAMGDIDGDTTDDLIIGAYYADGSGSGTGCGVGQVGDHCGAGETYVIYGGTPGVDLPAAGGSIDLDSESADLTVYGDDTEDHSGVRVAAGDIDGDTTDDLIIGAYHADGSGSGTGCGTGQVGDRCTAGETYVIYGGESLPGSGVIDLDSTPADLTVYGDDADDYSGRPVAAGDINGDTTDDLVIGAYYADGSGSGTGCGTGQVGDRCTAGETYVIYGGSSLPATIDLDNESAGVTVYGDDADDRSGWSAGTGDINGDTTDDVIIGARSANAATGETYVIYGEPGPYVVDSTGDDGDSNLLDNICDDGSGNCTLRAAIEQSNASAGTQVIEFNIPGLGPHSIQPGSALPTITGPVIIDGTTEPDFAGAPVIELDGTSATGANGLHITAGASTVRGLVINGFSGDGIQVDTNGGNLIEENYIGTDGTGAVDLGNGEDGVQIMNVPFNTVANNVISGNEEDGIEIWQSGATGNVVQGNFIGTDVTGTVDLGNTQFGVGISAPGNTVGGTTAEARNVISGNDGGGINIGGSGATGNTVQGNYIGTDVTGTIHLGNHWGVSIGDAPTNTIGGTAAGAGNVISGNEASGVSIGGSGATGNDVQGNYIGTDVTGTIDVGNSQYGVVIMNAPSNTIGGTAAGAGNLISGNDIRGVFIYGSGTTGNLVQGNFIGTDVTGTAALGNWSEGVSIAIEASSNTIGGTAAGAGNLISGHAGAGVVISDSGTTGNLVQGNYIGTDVSGTTDLGNAGAGVVITDAPSSTVGGTTEGARNVISGNDGGGVAISGVTATGSLVQGNYIGTDVNGTLDLGNSRRGVFILDAPGNTIGGTASGAGNVISGNDWEGIQISGSGATGNFVQGNFIGTDVNGSADLGNTESGVYIVAGPGNTIGGTTAEARNIISGNGEHGISIPGAGGFVQGNYIGTDATGTADLGNSGSGVLIAGPSNTVGGPEAGAGNVISGNGSDGIYIAGGGATGNFVAGNFIGTDVTGTVALGNNSYGFLIWDAPSNTIGGTTEGARNVISGNGAAGIYILGSAATGNQVQGNFIGTDVTGTADLGNTGSGVRINNGPSNTIGGTEAGARNVISGNGGGGVFILDSGATGNFVQGNLIGTDVTGTTALGNLGYGVSVQLDASSNTIGGTAAGAGNVISGNHAAGVNFDASGVTGNVVQGNYIGTDITGTADLGNWSDGVRINGGPSNTIGGTEAGARNVISGNFGYGVFVYESGATGNFVQGNYIGTDASGTADLGNAMGGVTITLAPGNTVGGTAAGAGNVISGNGFSGIAILAGVGNVVQGNYIGAQVDGSSPLGNDSHGVKITFAPMTNNIIGGTDSGAANTIAHNGGDGVFVEYGDGEAIRRNSIFSNAGLGIDLGGGGVTPNDPGDADAGPNNLQNFPDLTSAVGGSTTIQGTFNSTPSTAFDLDFYYGSSCDPSGNGEGENYLGSTTVVTNGGGDAPIDTTFPGDVPVGQFITATATDPLGNTSEFSGCVEVTEGPTPTPTPTATATPTPTPSPVIDLLAGTPGVFDFDGDGGPAQDALLNGPRGSFEVIDSNTLYFADTGNSRVRRISPNEPTGTITTVAGGGTPTPGFCGDGGPATDACLDHPYDVFADEPGNLYIADTNNNRIRVVNTQGQSIQVAGVTIDPGEIETVAGTGEADYYGDGGPALAAKLNGPRGVAVDDSGSIFIADTENHRIRKVDTGGTITTVAGNGTPAFSGDGGLATAASLNRPHDVYPYGELGDLLMADTLNNRIRRVDGFMGVIDTFAGSGLAADGGDGGLATLAHLNGPEAIAVDSAHNRLPNVFIADTQNHRIRRVDGRSTIITTVAGDGTPGSGGDGGDPTAAQLNLPSGVAVGSLTSSDTGNSTLRMIDPSTGKPSGRFSGLSCMFGNVSTADWVLVGFVLGLILARRRIRGLMMQVRVLARLGARPGMPG